MGGEARRHNKYKALLFLSTKRLCLIDLAFLYVKFRGIKLT